ncbi:acyltransferase family protein [Bosea sp. OAE506]|uniref:acyltransferase family protein n=1 Tax=Bosea sp. OAE506 TaxID=2663870 RepID=UPI003395B16A
MRFLPRFPAICICSQQLRPARFIFRARAWELMAGALCALTARRLPRHLGPLAGLVLISLALAGVSSSALGVAGPRLIAVLGACAIVASRTGSPVGHVLGNPLMRALGAISYPLYLWHWPILSFLHVRYGLELPASYGVAGVAAAFGLSVLTYRFVEMPIRHANSRFDWPKTLAAAVVVLGLLGGVTAQQDGFPGRLPQEVRAILGTKIDLARDARVGRCWLSSTMSPDELSPECLPSTTSDKPAVWIWGDSHAARLYVGVESEFGQRYGVGQMTRDGCPPVLGVGYELCRTANAAAVDAIVKAKPATIVLYAAWSLYASPQADDPLYRNLLETLQRLSSAGIKNIVVIGPPPHWSDELPALLLRAWTATGTVPLRLSGHLNASSKPIDLALQQVVRGTGTFISLLDILCDPDGCLTLVPQMNGAVFAPDYGHFSGPGAGFVAGSDPFRNALR